MFISEDNLDDLLASILKKVLSSKNSVNPPPTKGSNYELTGVLLELKNSRMRLSRSHSKGTIFSCLGELLWYLSGNNDLSFIQYYLKDYHLYSDDKKTVHGGYGKRIWKMHGKYDQFQNVSALLKTKPTSRRAVIQLFDASDLEKDYLDIPCTCTIQFLIRKNQLHTFTSMRSNDAYMGLPHDIFCFTMIQEIMARELSIEPGPYKHFVSSLHLYSKDFSKAKKYLKEGWHLPSPMPAMPHGSQVGKIKEVLACEKAIREGKRLDRVKEGEGYWSDVIRLLKIFRATRSKKIKSSVSTKIKKRIESRSYIPYINKRDGTPMIPSNPMQLEMSAFDEDEQEHVNT